MTVIGFFIACLLIHNFGMSGAWYFVAIIVAMADFFVGIIFGSASAQQGFKNVLDKAPGIRGTIDGGKSNG